MHISQNRTPTLTGNIPRVIFYSVERTHYASKKFKTKWIKIGDAESKTSQPTTANKSNRPSSHFLVGEVVCTCTNVKLHWHRIVRYSEKILKGMWKFASETLYLIKLHWSNIYRVIQKNHITVFTIVLNYTNLYIFYLYISISVQAGNKFIYEIKNISFQIGSNSYVTL